MGYEPGMYGGAARRSVVIRDGRDNTSDRERGRAIQHRGLPG